MAPGAAAGTAPLPAVARRIQPSLASSVEVRGSGTAPGRLKDSDRGLQVGSDLKSGFFPLPPAAPAQQKRRVGGRGTGAGLAWGAAAWGESVLGDGIPLSPFCWRL